MTESSHAYTQFTKEYHEYRIIKDSVFDMANEIVLYGEDKVALMMYSIDELSAVVIQSQSFFHALTGIFYTIRNSLE